MKKINLSLNEVSDYGRAWNVYDFTETKVVVKIYYYGQWVLAEIAKEQIDGDIKKYEQLHNSGKNVSLNIFFGFGSKWAFLTLT